MSDGHYVVKYKLEKQGVYKLNILIDKKHVGQSPYTLKCTVNKPNSQVGNFKGMKASKSLYSIREKTDLQLNSKNENNLGKYEYNLKKITKKA
jgi:hypothetical protein